MFRLLKELAKATLEATKHSRESPKGEESPKSRLFLFPSPALSRKKQLLLLDLIKLLMIKGEKSRDSSHKGN